MSGVANGQGGLFNSPASLAAAAAGACSALLALWAMRGLPLGGLLLWVAPLPIFLAGLAFGGRTAAYAAATAALCVLIFAPVLGFAVFLALFAVPVAVLVAQATAAPPRLDLSLPLATLGLWPCLVLLLLALVVPDLEGQMLAAVQTGVERLGLALPEGMAEQVAQVKAGAAGFWFAAVMLLNGIVAQRFLARRGLALRQAPLAEAIRLPHWYLPLPAAALGATLAVGGAVALSALLVLLVPFFILGVVSVHARLRGRPARMLFLAGFYLLLLLFLQIVAPLMVGLGLFEQIRRRAAPPPT